MMILLLVGALLMRLGLSIYAAGSVRSKNVASVLGRNLLDWTIGLLVFWSVGGAIVSQTSNPYFGLDTRLLFNAGPYEHGLGSFALLAVMGSIVIGATAERSRLFPMLLLSAIAAAIVFPVATNWESVGWLRSHGFIDQAGGAAVHVAGAAMAWVAVRFVGPRDGKYHRDGSASMIPGHSLPMILMGAWLAAVGGVILIGSTFDAASPVVNVILASAASVLACAAYFQIKYSKIDLPVLAAALLGGVVAMSSAGGSVTERAAVLIGAVAGLLIALFVVKLDLVAKLDDVTCAVSIHGIAGAWGVLAAGLFRTNEAVSRWKAVGVQTAGLVAIALLAMIVTWLSLAIVSRVARLRTHDTDEFDGLDLSEHDVGSYPDFQQNTIKSFHLREQ